jgi:hypothetical protein
MLALLAPPAPISQPGVTGAMIATMPPTSQPPETAPVSRAPRGQQPCSRAQPQHHRARPSFQVWQRRLRVFLGLRMPLLMPIPHASLVLTCPFQMLIHGDTVVPLGGVEENSLALQANQLPFLTTNQARSQESQPPCYQLRWSLRWSALETGWNRHRT